MWPSSGVVLYWIYEEIQSTKHIISIAEQKSKSRIITTAFIVNDENSDTN